jgi:RNA polymerase sigma factor (sigma-70 family)
MEQSIVLQRCLDIIAQLDAEHGWGLTPQARQGYAQRITALCAGASNVSDAELSRMLRYYHTEHQLVEALLDRANPDHATRWTEWTQQALRWLKIKCASFAGYDSAISLEDLVQEAMADLWRGLRTYRYRSRFQTWAFTVIANCLVRHYRTYQTQKRGAFPQTHSLDAMIAVGETLFDRVTPAPDDVALSDGLAALLQQVLRQHPDVRLRAIFQLWAFEEQTLRAIGEQLNLSATRVHGLLTQALTLLRRELATHDWVERDPSDVALAQPSPDHLPDGLETGPEETN